jgi:adenine-specific DNA-methyltransferase
MDKLSTLAKDFSLDNLESYLLDKEFTVDVSQVYDIQDIEEKYNVSDIKEIGYIRLKQEADLVVFAIKIDNLTERTSKKKQFDIAKKLLEKYQKFYGLFVFYDDSKNFRLSFVFKTTHGTKAKYSHYKRFTFYVSPNLPNKTFIIQLKDCDFTDLNSIKQAFSVEPITKEFYNELQNWYYYAMDQVKFPDDYKYSDDPEKDKEIRNAQSLIRLITRLIFIWFLKEKGLVPSNLFNEKELKKIIKDFGKGNNYYNAILQNLFFATLNKPIEERGWAEDKGFPANKKDFGVKSLYRYEDKLLISKEEVLKLFLDIPFINGGLFDCLDKDKVYIDGFSRNEKKQAKISDELFFSSKEKTVDLSNYGLSKYAKVRGLIDILNSYNFTTDEATPIDQEIALDPELLGKVFENLLASYNPETQTTARKATGSYYTPREIVDYMVEESLREYLETKVPEAQEILDDLFSYSVEELSIPKDLRLKLIKAIDQVKIIDPACGSGAFPMGILHKLVFLLQKLDPKNETWKEIQLERASKEADAVFRSEKEKQEREKLLEEINENFDESINYPDYARKLYLIENCIYGVDIQPIAIQISKLRFFISLILDQKVDRSKPNFGILTLPNLETKFISANTLIGLEKSLQKSLRNPEIERLEQELKFLRHRYFRIKSRAEKIQLQNEDRELREKLKKALIRGGWGDQVAEKIVKFDIFDQNASTDWFDPEWMFGVRDGFDIVIGNPPYVRQEKIRPIKPILQEQNYKVFISTADLYVYFYEKGYKLLKEQGILAYITSNKWMRAKYGENLRKFFKLKTTILEIIDFGGYRVFEQTVDTNILIFRKQKPFNEHVFEFLDVKSNVEGIEKYLTGGDWQTMYQNKLSVNAWTLGDESVLSLKEKIEKVGKPLKEWDVKIYRGVVTGYNDAFIIDTETRNRILANCKDKEERKRTEEIIKPVLRGRDIDKYSYKWAGLWLIYIPWHFPLYHDTSISGASLKAEEEFKKKYLSLYSYLLQFKDRLLKRNKDETGIRYEWYALQRWASDYYPEFEKEKIVWAETSDRIKMCIVPAGIYLSKTCFMITGKNLKFIIGIANSKLMDWYIRQSIHKLGEKGIYASGYFMEQLPLPPVTKENQPIADQIIQKVDQILSAKKQNPFADTRNLEHQIDQLVYKLYGLTSEEIKIIEGGR